MNKLTLVLLLVLVGCSTATAPTRVVLDCSEIVTDPQMVPKDQYKWCTYKQVPATPSSAPLKVRPELIDKNQK